MSKQKQNRICCSAGSAETRYSIPCYTDKDVTILCFGDTVSKATGVFQCSQRIYEKFAEHVKGRSAEIHLIPQSSSTKQRQPTNTKFRFLFT